MLKRLRKELPRNLYYHSIEHTRDVLTRVEELAKAEDISERDMSIATGGRLLP